LSKQQKLYFKAVFLRVGGTPPLGTIWRNKRAKKNKGGDRGAKQNKGGENYQPIIDH